MVLPSKDGSFVPFPFVPLPAGKDDFNYTDLWPLIRASHWQFLFLVVVKCFLNAVNLAFVLI